MKSQALLDQIAEHWNILEHQLHLLQREKKNNLEYAQFALMETDESIRQIKKLVIVHDFDCWENEIRFFKDLKPLFISRYIYYSKITTLLSSLPASGAKFRKKILESEFEKLQYFFLEHRDFVSYYRRKATYLDLKYFLRFKYDLDVPLAPDFHSYDERFSTSHDHLAATIRASDDYELYLKKQLNLLRDEDNKSQDIVSGVRWTASKTALTELVFAVHQAKCLNGGSMDLAETVRWFENELCIDLGNYHKTFGDIRNRKSPQTRFLNQLIDGLGGLMEKMEE